MSHNMRKACAIYVCLFITVYDMYINNSIPFCSRKIDSVYNDIFKTSLRNATPE